MRTIGSATIPSRWRGLLAALFAVSIVFGGAALADAPVAGAGPKEWDIGDYNQCVSDMPTDIFDNPLAHGDYRRSCCLKSGGEIGRDGQCVAPAAAGAPVRLPPTAPPGVLTQVPVAPSGPVTGPTAGPGVFTRAPVAPPPRVPPPTTSRVPAAPG